MENYKPINGELYEELEWLSMQQIRSEIVFRADNGGRSVVTDRIEKLFTKNDEAGYLTLNSGLEIRLDMLLEINGKKIDNYC